MKEIQIKIGGVNKIIYFGMPNSQAELENVFRLRYETYLKYKYIEKDLFPEGLEKDNYDKENKCNYFIAKIDDEIIGSARIIKEKYLPTEKDCFKFNEPDEIKSIPREKRLEISRLITKNYIINGKSLPRHLVMIGIIYIITNFSLKNGFKGGYSFIKTSLEKKFKKLGFPFHHIKPYTQIYSQKYLDGYFNDKKNPVIPIYYLAKEAEECLDNIFNNKRIFKKNTKEKYTLLNNNVLNFLIHVKINNIRKKIKIWK